MAKIRDRRGTAPQTLFKIVLMLGLVLAGVAALAAEPDDADTGTAHAACARTSFEFDGRVTQNDEATDNWTLTCWRAPGTVPESAGEASAAPAAEPVRALPVATEPAHPDHPPAPARF